MVRALDEARDLVLSRGVKCCHGCGQEVRHIGPHTVLHASGHDAMHVSTLLQVALKSIEFHQDSECPVTTVQCVNGCGIRVPRLLASYHQGCECPKRIRATSPHGRSPQVG